MRASWKPTVAGVLTIIAGAFNMLSVSVLSLGMPIVASCVLFRLGTIALIWFVSGILAIIGGVFALQRRRWGLSLAGAICALMPPSTLLGILSTVFLALSREEYRDGTATAFSMDRSQEGSRSLQATSSSSAECQECGVRLHEPSEGERNA